MKSGTTKSIKTGLKFREVSKDHFSSNLSSRQSLPFTHIVVRLLHGSNLLASDVSTGKSDPVCFLWVGQIDAVPNFDFNTKTGKAKDAHVFTSKVCHTTVDPIWNEDITLPIIFDDINAILTMKLCILVRDEDVNDDNTISYDDLGLIELTFQQIFNAAKVVKGAMLLSARKFSLKKTANMRRVDGDIKMTISINFADEDCASQIERPELGVSNIQELIQKLKSASNQSGVSISQEMLSDDESYPISSSESFLNDKNIQKYDMKNIDEEDDEEITVIPSDVAKTDAEAALRTELKPPITSERMYPEKIEEILDDLSTLKIRMNQLEILEEQTQLRLSKTNDEVLKPTKESVNSQHVESEDHNLASSIKNIANNSLSSSWPPSQNSLNDNLIKVAKDKDFSTAAGGSAVTAARALKEVALQRDLLQKHLEELTKMTSHELAALNQRLDMVEKRTIDLNAYKPFEPSDAQPVSRASSVSNISKAKSGAGGNGRIQALRQFKQLAMASKQADIISKTGPGDNSVANNFDAQLIMKSANGEIKGLQIEQSQAELDDRDNAYQETYSKSKTVDKDFNYDPSRNVDPFTRSANRISSGMKYAVNWSKVEKWISAGDLISCYAEVLDRGNLEDLVKLMELTGPKPQELSISLRNRTYDSIAIMLSQNMNVERSLIWILGIVRGKQMLAATIGKYTIRELVDALQIASREPSRRGLLASLLASQLEKVSTHNKTVTKTRIT